MTKDYLIREKYRMFINVIKFKQRGRRFESLTVESLKWLIKTRGERKSQRRR